jgi:hypothetical protein
MKRLASLTTRTNTSELMRMDKLYPLHVKALQAVNLAPNSRQNPQQPTNGPDYQ